MFFLDSLCFVSVVSVHSVSWWSGSDLTDLGWFQLWQSNLVPTWALHILNSLVPIFGLNCFKLHSLKSNWKFYIFVDILLNINDYMNTNSYFVCLWLLFWTSRCSQFLLLLLVPNLSTDDTSPGGNASTTKGYKRCRKNNSFCNLLRIQLRVPNFMFSVMTFISHDRIWETKCSSRFWHWKKTQRNHVFAMVARCSLLLMHKIFPLFAFIYIKRLLCTLEGLGKHKKVVLLSVATNSLYCAKCYLCSWTSGCISSLVLKNQSPNQLLPQLHCSAGWGEEKDVHQ